jgi:hypothetical protein
LAIGSPSADICARNTGTNEPIPIKPGIVLAKHIGELTRDTAAQAAELIKLAFAQLPVRQHKALNDRRKALVVSFRKDW